VEQVKLFHLIEVEAVVAVLLLQEELDQLLHKRGMVEQEQQHNITGSPAAGTANTGGGGGAGAGGSALGGAGGSGIVIIRYKFQ
jgi:hypothetical protein